MKRLQVEPLEKNKKMTTLSTPSFSLLPDDITVNYLARIPRPYYPRLSTVSKSFKSILSSTEVYIERSRLGTTEQCIYISIWEANRFPQWFRLWINPNRTLASSSVIKKKTLGQLLVPIPYTDIFNCSQVVVGSEIYAMGQEIDGGPSSIVKILDCRTHTWRNAPRMNVAREFSASCVYDEKIYVLGGCKEDDEPWAEVFDLKTQTWEPLPEPGTVIRKTKISRITVIQGKIKFARDFGYERIIAFAYDPKQGKWEHLRNARDIFFSSECVIENVSYSCFYDNRHYYDPFRISWYDIKVGTWGRVEGLESFQEKHSGIRGNCVIDSSKVVSCGGKLLLVWEERRNDNKICCAEIKVEKRDEGEVWGKVEWADVVLTIPTSRRSLFDCLSVSV